MGGRGMYPLPFAGTVPEFFHAPLPKPRRIDTSPREVFLALQYRQIEYRRRIIGKFRPLYIFLPNENWFFKDGSMAS